MQTNPHGKWEISKIGPRILQHKSVNYYIKSRFHTILNSLGSSDAIWRPKTWSTLAQVMACCLTAPSHYLNQWWLIISKVQWHSSEGNFTAGISVINHCNWLEKYSPKISLKSPRPQWVKSVLDRLTRLINKAISINGVICWCRIMDKNACSEEIFFISRMIVSIRSYCSSHFHGTHCEKYV